MNLKRAPDITRRKILEAAYEEIHHVGFQAASLSKILQRVGVTKGALYHHFSSKQVLGYMVVDELIRDRIERIWSKPLRLAPDPIAGLVQVLQQQEAELGEQVVRLGCPLNNLTQEMAPVDEGFRCRLEDLYSLWRESISSALRRGQQNGSVRQDRDADQCALFIVSAIEGCTGAAKCAQSRQVLIACMSALLDYLQGLRP